MNPIISKITVKTINHQIGKNNLRTTYLFRKYFNHTY